LRGKCNLRVIFRFEPYQRLFEEPEDGQL